MSAPIELLSLAGVRGHWAHGKAVTLLQLAAAEHDDLTPIFGASSEQVVLLAADACSRLRAVDFLPQFEALRTAVAKYQRWLSGTPEAGDNIANESQADGEVLHPLASLVYGKAPCPKCFVVAYNIAMAIPADICPDHVLVVA